MLTLTDSATTVVKSIVTSRTELADAGLRIDAGAADTREFRIDVVDAPVSGDQVVDADGVRVFVDERAALLLDDKVLDASVADTGAITFALLPQV